MIKGAASLLDGFTRLFAEASLRSVLWRIVLMLFVLMLAVGFGVYSLAEYLAALWLPSGDAWYWQILSWLVWALAVALALFTGAVSFTVLGSVAVAPWLETLAVRAEALHRGTPLHEAQGGWLAPVMSSLANSVRPLFGLLLMGLAALVVIWVPVVGQMAAMLIWGYAGIRFLSYELMDVPASRRGWSFVQRRQQMAERRFFWLGFGGLSMGLMLLPGINLLVLPAAVVALSAALPERLDP
ncbi:MAG: EI24 domain-containing protein [Mariprofundaceae bacterium]|nr:EI24 domain-containing protein [Mariprofundaceae bacterium]